MGVKSSFSLSLGGPTNRYEQLSMAISGMSILMVMILFLILILTEVNISPENQYFLTDPKNGPAPESRDPLVPGQKYLCTIGKKGNFSAHGSNISAQTPKKRVFMHN